MRVGLLSYNARVHDAVGNHVAETAAFFLERGAEVRVFLQSTDRLHPALRDWVQPVDAVDGHGPVWDFLAGADLVIAQYSQSYALLQFLPMLADGKPRLLLDYLGVTPPDLWPAPNREILHDGQRQRALVWCVDAAIAHSEFTRRELSAATGFPVGRIHRLPLVVDPVRFRPGAQRTLHHRLGLDDALILLYVGRLAPNKRVPLLVEALAHLPSRVHAVVVGDASDVYAAEAQRCRERAQALRVADRLHVVGQLGDDDLAAAYRSADVLVIPSRHEGFCVPVMEAMAAGLPVVASRSAALPETVGDAGLTFAPDDAADLARQVGRVLHDGRSPARDQIMRRIAIVCFRFGADIVGGAETSLRTIARTLADAGHHVEVFTTCTRSESDWRNELPTGPTTCAGLTVHRFPIDAHDRHAHLAAVRDIVEAPGPVAPDAEQRYLQHSLHSTALLQALAERAEALDAIIVGPYLFGLTLDVARAFPERTLVLPCFHDEPIAHLAVWPNVYGSVGGLLLHSPEEQRLTLEQLGINCPNIVEIGTWIETARAGPQPPVARPYVVYCGRYSAQKHVPLLLEWMHRYQEQRRGRFDLVCMGRGEVPMPSVPWLRDLGCVSEERKRAVLAGARALVQLSQQESLSLVTLEAWAQETPVIVHAGCAVLAGQVNRAGGGVVVADYDGFARALNELADAPDAARERGRRGRSYVEERYALRAAFRERLEQAIASLDVPLRERMRQRGLERAACCDRGAWREGLSRIVEDLLDAGSRPHHPAIAVRPLRDEVSAPVGSSSIPVTVRVENQGTHAAVADGPARTVLRAEVRDVHSDAVIRTMDTPLPVVLVPDATQTVMLLAPVPPHAGDFDLCVSAVGGESVRVTLHVGDRPGVGVGLAPLLDDIRQLLVEARQGQRLPDDYVDVTQGWFARAKRWIKKTLLYNFKHAYVDVLSRQQSRVNEQLTLAVQQLAECCATLDHALRGAQARPDQPEPRTLDRTNGVSIPPRE